MRWSQVLPGGERGAECGGMMAGGRAQRSAGGLWRQNDLDHRPFNNLNHHAARRRALNLKRDLLNGEWS